MPSKTRPVAIVTGANRGIGLGVVQQLAAAGYTVILGSRDLKRGREAHASIGSPENVEPMKLDITKRASIDKVVEAVLEKYKRIDVLVNNAGINYDTWHDAANADLAQVRETFETNFFGAWEMAQAVVPAMRKKKFGRIVNVSSGAGTITEMGSGTPGYSASKAAMNAFTRVIADDLRGSGILVNSVCPGWVRTDMGGSNATRSIEEGAKSVIWAATLPDNGPTGGFFRDGKAIPW